MLQSSQLAVTSPESLELQWQDVLGLAARTAFKVQVNAVDDRQPDVQLKALEPQAVVLDTDAVKFDIQSRDDFGLKQVGLEWARSGGSGEQPGASAGQSSGRTRFPGNAQSRRPDGVLRPRNRSQPRHWNCEPGRKIISMGVAESGPRPSSFMS